MRRFAIRSTTDGLDPVTEFEQIARLLTTREFVWDINQALSFALFRTYGVPSIGGLLFDTGEFTERVQKRYDDTALILDAVLDSGFASPRGRSAIRRMNRMHGSYDISTDDMRYVLATFVVCPVRWMREYGWRRMTHTEIVGWTNYYRELGRHMAIPDVPETYEQFADLLDRYEHDHFAYDPGGRAVADSTLELMCTFPPNDRVPAPLVRRFARGLMDDPLLDAFRYRHPLRLERILARGALRLRGRIVRLMPPRRAAVRTVDLPNIRSYPNGYRVEQLGTFPTGCPVGSGAGADHHHAERITS